MRQLFYKFVFLNTLLSNVVNGSIYSTTTFCSADVQNVLYLFESRSVRGSHNRKGYSPVLTPLAPVTLTIRSSQGGSGVGK